MTETLAWLDSALNGTAAPWLIALALAATTLLFEDVAIAAGVAAATHGALAWEWAVLAVAFGIAAGDLLLYAAGRGTLRLRWVQRRATGAAVLRVRQRLLQSLPSAVLIARVIPGLRLTTYVACGAMHVPFRRFAVLVAGAVALWTIGLFALSFSLGMALSARLGVPAPIAVALPMLAVAVVLPAARALRAYFKGVPA